MEKFYIVINEEFLGEIDRYMENSKNQRTLVKTFFDEHGIAGEEYHIGGNGFVNCQFSENEKSQIRLHILGCDDNNEKFGKELLKPVKLFCDSDAMMRSFRANSKTLKAFQDLCVEQKIVINIHPIRIGDYFKELHYGGYSSSYFEYDGNMYLRVKKDVDSITPEKDGFTEIKGSEYFKAKEAFEEKNNDK